MGNLTFPQLASGALAQFPIRKTRTTRTISNVLPDGSLILSPDPEVGKSTWELGYSALSAADLSALTALFAACQGRFHAFTFLDPTDNLLSMSSNLLAAAWQSGPGIDIVGRQSDPAGGSAAFLVTNAGQAYAELSQTLPVPAGYQYCFSVYAMSAQPTSLQLIQRGPNTQSSTVVSASAQWTRAMASTQLNDNGDSFTVAVGLEAGEQVFLYGPQLDAQTAPSRYRPTLQSGGIYDNAHWAVDELLVSADGPDLFSTAFTLETTP